LVVVNREDGALRAALPHALDVASLAWRPDNRTLATASSDFNIRLWDADTGRLRLTLAGHQAQVTDVVFHPAGELLLSCSWDGTTRLWESDTGHLLVTLPVAGQYLTLSPDGSRLCFRDWADRQILVCEVAGERVCRSLQEPLPTATGESSKGPRCAQFSPDGRLLVAATYDGVRLWDWMRNVEAAHLPLGYCWSVCFDARDASLFVFSQDKGIQRWSLRGSGSGSGDEIVLGPPQILSAGGKSYARGCLSQEGGTLACVQGSNYEVRQPDGTRFQLPGADDFQGQLALSLDGRWLATCGGRSQRLSLWDLDARRELWTRPVRTAAMLAFSPDGRSLASNADEEVCLWEVPTGRVTWRVARPYPGDTWGPLAFSPDGRLLAVAQSRTAVQLLDAATGAALGSLESPAPRIASWIAFSPSGTMLVVANEAHIIRLWDLRALRRQLAELGLDWDQPPYPPALPAATSAGPIKVRFVQ